MPIYFKTNINALYINKNKNAAKKNMIFRDKEKKLCSYSLLLTERVDADKKK